MANLLVLILDNVEQFPEILEAWETAGVPGVTVLDSAGSRKFIEHANRDDLPLMPSLRALVSGDEAHNRTLFTVIEDEAVLERAVQVAQKIVGDFMQPHTGIMFVVPIGRTWGVPKAKRKSKTSATP